ncbi:MAG: D-aminoacyl-tRNA deacylase [Thermoplasmata archaeon]|nr:D-aminoacyl-tRNA deacylase [Thermoplasmata archaeon]
MRPPEYVVVLSDVDPVAQAVSEDLGTGSATGDSVDGAPLRQLSDRVVTLHRSVAHIHDERLDLRLPQPWRESPPTLVFPSVHRSESGHDALTVHPLGNPGPTAEVGGQPGVLDPTDPLRMTDALRRLSEGAGAVGWPVCFEATHHGPELEFPAFFVEVGGQDPDHPPAAATRLIAAVVRELIPDTTDRVVLGVGGGHYAPHFTDLALRRSLAFGHILPRHVLDGLLPATAGRAWRGTPGAQGAVYARAADSERAVAREWGARFREADAPRREGRTIPTSPRSGDDRSAGT